MDGHGRVVCTICEAAGRAMEKVVVAWAKHHHFGRESRAVETRSSHLYIQPTPRISSYATHRPLTPEKVHAARSDRRGRRGRGGCPPEMGRQHTHAAGSISSSSSIKSARSRRRPTAAIRLLLLLESRAPAGGRAGTAYGRAGAVASGVGAVAGGGWGGRPVQYHSFRRHICLLPLLVG